MFRRWRGSRGRNSIESAREILGEIVVVLDADGDAHEIVGDGAGGAFDRLAVLGKTLDAADELAKSGIEADVIDLRTLRPFDAPAVLASVARTHRAVVVDEGWRTGSFAAEVSARIAEEALYELDAPVARVCSVEVPIPYARHLEDAALPQVPRIVAAARATIGGA
jgi:pyruvate/2-oxoglutarate/acetoin dehydrogenase E1 component